MASVRSKRSGGCETCLKRKVRCDETRPACNRCGKAGIECAGYHRPARFVDERERILAALIRDSENASRWNRGNSGMTIRSSLPTTNTALDVQRPKLTPELDLNAFQDVVYVAFLKERLFQLPGQKKALGHWMDAVSREDVDSALSLSVQSLAASFYGRVHRQPAITARGAQLYGSALVQFSELLQNPRRCWSFEALGCASALELYELVTYTVPFGWVRHAGGIGTMFESRGPWLHKGRSQRKVFLEQRINIVLNAILNRKRTFLEQRIWKEVPWEDDEPSKTPLDYLIDIFCDYPGLLEDMDKARQLTETAGDSTEKWNGVFNRCQAKLIELSEWHRLWVAEYAISRYEVDATSSSKTSIEAGGPLFSTIFYFTDIWRAYEFCVHRAVRILLLRLYTRIQDLAGNALVSLVEQPSLSVLSGTPLEVLATEICRSIDYFLNKYGHLGALLLMFPAQIALLPLDAASPAAVWLNNVLGKIGESDGLEIGSQITVGRCSDLARTCS